MLNGPQVAGLLAVVYSILCLIGCFLFTPLVILKVKNLEKQLSRDKLEFRRLEEGAWLELSRAKGELKHFDLNEEAKARLAKRQTATGRLLSDRRATTFFDRNFQRQGNTDRGNPNYPSTGGNTRPNVATSDRCYCDATNHCPRGEPGFPGQPGRDGINGLKGGPGHPGTPGNIPRDILLTRQGCRLCPPGPRGSAGRAGTRGLPGRKGATGQDAQSGQPGIVGAQGEPGRTGDAGQPGQSGPRGLKGTDGYLGEIGDRGKKGRPGSRGPTGARGLQGRAGAPGGTGPQGLSGVRGKVGDPGIPGTNGAEGLAGQPGPDAGYCICPDRSSNQGPPPVTYILTRLPYDENFQTRPVSQVADYRVTTPRSANEYLRRGTPVARRGNEYSQRRATASIGERIRFVRPGGRGSKKSRPAAAAAGGTPIRGRGTAGSGPRVPVTAVHRRSNLRIDGRGRK